MSEVIQNQELDRFELVIDGDVAGFTAYRIDGKNIVFTHTEVNSDEREHGLAGRLVQAALDQVREHMDYRVVAQCPYVSHWISQHPDYQDLLRR
jgi:uncharacterized protein